jgi:hypothetical protein
MANRTVQLKAAARRGIATVFDRLDYQALGDIYCDEGGDEFWKAKRQQCRRMGTKLGLTLLSRLKTGGTSLYVGAGVAEIPLILLERMELGRSVTACNLRKKEVAIINQACDGLPCRFRHLDAGSVRAKYDHLWFVSVANDPERFPELSALSYGRANPVTFRGSRFISEQRSVAQLVGRCLSRLTLPGLVTTTVEEVVWIAEWCHSRGIPYRIEDKTFPSPTVGDPICLVHLDVRSGRPSRRVRGSTSNPLGS